MDEKRVLKSIDISKKKKIQRRQKDETIKKEKNQKISF